MIRKLISRVLNMAICLIAVAAALLIGLYLMGVRSYVVRSGSMEPAVGTGSLCFVDTGVSFESIGVNDIIAYDTSLKQHILHRVVAVHPEGLETKGDANDRSDGISTNENNYLGKCIFDLPYLGYAAAFVQTKKGFFLCVFGLVGMFLCSCLVRGKEDGRAVRKCRKAISGNKP